MDNMVNGWVEEINDTAATALRRTFCHNPYATSLLRRIWYRRRIYISTGMPYLCDVEYQRTGKWTLSTFWYQVPGMSAGTGWTTVLFVLCNCPIIVYWLLPSVPCSSHFFSFATFALICRRLCLLWSTVIPFLFFWNPPPTFPNFFVGCIYLPVVYSHIPIFIPWMLLLL